MITSTRNDLIKRLCRLRTQLVKLPSINTTTTTIITGSKLVTELCSHIQPKMILTTPQSLPHWKQTIRHQPHHGFELAEERVVRHVMGVNNTNENEAIVAEINVPLPVSATTALSGATKPIITACYKLSDPGNMGNIIRTSYSLGCKAMFMFDQDTVNPYNEKCTRAARGANFLMPIICGDWTSLASLINERNFACIMTSTSAENAISLDRLISSPQERKALFKYDGFIVVLGSEHHGISNNDIQSIDATRIINVHIPMEHDFDSLNVSVAASIVLYVLKHT
jgi:tRNA G18 (ribose-2'-O)-methylase SpoU